MQRDTGNTESITIEYGFLDGNGDDVNQLKNNWQNYAEAVVRAIIKYLNLTYVPIDNIMYYTVNRGDSLWSIAKRFNTTVDKIKKANGLNSSLLKIGQVLQIPVLDSFYEFEDVYVVQKGDTLYNIAKKFNTTVADIKTINNLISNTLSIGQILKIPGKSNEKYIVQKGDTLYKIAKDNGTTVDNLINLNGLSSAILSIGQEIKIPK